MLKCPMCDNQAGPIGQNKTFPFCSERCKLLDLGNWLNEQYRVTAEPSTDEEIIELAEAYDQEKRDLS